MRMGPDVIRADLSTTQTRLRAGGGGYKVRKWCSFGGGVWEVWTKGRMELEMHRNVCKLVNRRVGVFRVWESRRGFLLIRPVVTDAIAGEGLLF